MRILWVKAGGLVPLDSGGKIRSFQTLKELSQRHEITLYTFYEAHSDDVHDQLRDMLARVIMRPLELPRRRSVADYALFARIILSGGSYTMRKFYLPRIRGELAELCLNGLFDVLVCDFIVPAGMMPWSGPTPVVLFTHNVEAEIWKRHFRLTRNPARKAAFWLEYQALSRQERRYARLADQVIAVSQRNADHFRRLVSEDRVSVVPTGVDTEYFQPDLSTNEAGADIVFTGSMDWLPNEDCVRYCVESILPLIQQRVPETRFWAVGRNPSAALKALSDGSRVIVTGTVEDIRPYLHRAQAYVVPMRSGSGTRLKVLEAMASGMAVVSSSIGAEGLPVTHNEHVLLADAPDDFASAVISLINDPERRRELGSAARQLVEQKCSWGAVGAEFEEILRSATDK
jgi:sugar transferase (PEP-CTERM/EpsH1 system associated)